jgi:hypothetical protein
MPFAACWKSAMLEAHNLCAAGLPCQPRRNHRRDVAPFECVDDRPRAEGKVDADGTQHFRETSRGKITAALDAIDKPL